MAATGDTSPGLDLSPVEILSTTRSVRRRLDLTRPVDQTLIEQCLDLAQQAPTGGNQQGWSFVVVTDPRKRQALGALYKQGWDAYRQSMAEPGYRPRVSLGAIPCRPHG
jgi:nitroreductase